MVVSKEYEIYERLNCMDIWIRDNGSILTYVTLFYDTYIIKNNEYIILNDGEQNFKIHSGRDIVTINNEV